MNNNDDFMTKRVCEELLADKEKAVGSLRDSIQADVDRIAKRGRKPFSKDKLRTNRITISLNDEELELIRRAIPDGELAESVRNFLVANARNQ